MSFRPAVRKLSSVEMFNDAVRQHNDSVFFIYIGDSEQEDLFVSSVVQLLLLLHYTFCVLFYTQLLERDKQCSLFM